MNQSEITIWECFDTWLEMSVYGYVNKGTYVCYRCAIKQLKSVLQNKKVNELTRVDFQNALLKLAEQGYTYSTITKARTVIYQSLEFISQNSSFISNSMRLKVPKKAPTRKVEALNDTEQRAIEQECLRDLYGDVFLFLLYTGLRRSELCNLKWSDVDFQKECIYIRKSKTDNGILMFASQ